MANRGSGSRRLKHWHGLAGGVSNLTAAGTSLFTSFGAPDTPSTILRMIFEYAIGPTSAPTALDGCVISMGLGIVSTDAAAVGATAMPDPSTNGDPEFPWLWTASHVFHMPDTDPAAAVATASGRFFVDNRAMRILRPRSSLAFVLQYEDVNGTPPMSLAIGGARVLFQD